MNAAPSNLALLSGLLATAAPADRGSLWRLATSGRQLDANLVRLPPHGEVGEHQEDGLDVLLVVLAGGGRVVTGAESLDLTPTTVTWLPRTSRRALVAGPDGLAFLTVHRRRPGMTIGRAPGPGIAGAESPGAVSGPAVEEGGEAPCGRDRVCAECGRMAEGRAPKYCAECGTALGG
ncbi:hypothetical protein [uncultured Streptomyces sp.]|uniref:cupin domain-containing protein n=1 Tax=uncultured Streptomyces sp. TaxID=174707 RepID=UPI00260B6929|nr:hypothetical protein [uncultured Streptomyces sp.]